jgi:hypothetical protein
MKILGQTLLLIDTRGTATVISLADTKARRHFAAP